MQEVITCDSTPPSDLSFSSIFAMSSIKNLHGSAPLLEESKKEDSLDLYFSWLNSGAKPVQVLLNEKIFSSEKLLIFTLSGIIHGDFK